MFTCHMTTFCTYMYAWKMEGSCHKLTFDRDYPEVCRSLRNLHRRVELIALGTALGLSYQTVQGMGINGDDLLSQIIAAWLKKQDNVLGQSGEPTWSILSDKLEEIECSEIAADIRRKHDGPQHISGNLSTALSTDVSDSLMDDQPSSRNLSGHKLDAPCSLDQTIVPTSILQPVTQPKQDQPHEHTSASLICLEQPPIPKRTKLDPDHQSIREQSDSQQLSYAAQKPMTTYTYTMGKMHSPIVTLPTADAEPFHHPPSSVAQPTEKEMLQSTSLPQAVPPTLTTTSTTVSTPLCLVASAPAAPSSTLALPSTGGQDLTLIRAEEAGEAFREHRAALLVAVTDPLILANSLYSKRVISRDILEQIKLPSSTDSAKNFILLDAIEARIRTCSSDFLALLAILESDAQLCVFAEDLRNSYSEMCAQSSLLSLQPVNSSATMQLNTYLMNYYKCSQKPFDIKFPHLQEKTFISLAVIEKTLVSRASADTFTKGTLHGHADEILKEKKPIELESVLEPPEGQQSMKCVFVEGAPGIGKSTFALELCRRQEGSRTYSLVVLLRLRENRVHEMQSIGDLFYHKPDLQQAVTDEVIACEGKNVLFILDGFDELPAKLRSSSFIVELIQGKHLPACTVVVTSRPSATADLLFSGTQINKRIEILGFTHERIKQYAESMLSDEPDVLEDFLRYISNNPAIHGMMYIPLNSAIVLAIYKANRTTDKPVPHTLTELYTELCLALLKKYLTERGDPLVEKVHDTFQDLPETLKDQLKKLGKLAFEGAKRGEITFKQLPEGCGDLGFMNISTEFYLGRKSVVSYSFLHLTLQEFLAAFYISQLPDIEQKLLYIENNESLMHRQSAPLREIRSVIHKYACIKFRISGYNMDVMWRFMAGLTGFRDIGWELVHKAIRKPLSHSQRNLGHPPLLIQSLFEVHDVQELKGICDIIVKNMELKAFIDVNAQSLFDCYAAGYCIAASKHEWSVDLSAIGGDEVVKMFACGLRCVGDIGGYFCVLNLSSNSLTHQSMTYLNEIPPKLLNKIKVLALSDNQLDSTGLDLLSNAILKMRNLSDLSIANNPVGNGGMIKLLGVITNVCELDLAKINFGPNDIIALSQFIKHSIKLMELNIGDKSMSNECVALLIETILSLGSLSKVKLCRLRFTDENARKFELLENNNNLCELKFINCIGLDLAVQYVAEALHKNESLVSLGLLHTAPVFLESTEYNNANLGKSGVIALSEMLKVNKTLKSLIIYIHLSDDDVLTLISTLQVNSSLKGLIFHPQVKLVERVMFPTMQHLIPHI